MNYLDWNHRICSHVFSPKKNGSRVWLYVTEDVIDDLGRENGKGLADFIRAVKEGYGLAKSHRNICDAAHAWVKSHWRMLDKAGFEGPPYLAYLALFVLAAGHGDKNEYHPNMYYQRLNDLLGRDHETITSSHFGKIDDLWTDLEQWANIDNQGRYGIFQTQEVGLGVHVGKAIAQSLLSEYEVEGVKSVFYKYGLTPEVVPTDAELASVLLSNGRSFLTNRTKRLLSQDDSEIKNALLDQVEELLESWDGTAPETLTTEQQSATRTSSASLLWNLLFDDFNSIREIRTRCSTASDFPEEPLQLSLPNADVAYRCEEFKTGWTTPLRSENGAFLQANQLDWDSSAPMTDASEGWNVHLGSNSLRLLVEGSSIGLPGYIETKQLPPFGPIILAVAHDRKEEVVKWLETTGDKPYEELYGEAVPKRWSVFRVKDLPALSDIGGTIPLLSRNTRVSMSLLGGLKHSRQNEYFTFAPPVIKTTTTAPIEVLCNSVPLEGVGGYYRFEEHHIRQHRVQIEVLLKGTVVKSRTIFFHDQVPWPVAVSDLKVDELGLLSKTGGISGSAILVDHDSNYNPSIYPQLPELSSRRVFLVGRQPGQIVNWPQEGLPEWPVIWAIPLTRTGSAVYCGLGLSSSTPLSPSSKPKKAQVADWKKVLYSWRKRITPPSKPAVRSLWREYQRVARDV